VAVVAIPLALENIGECRISNAAGTRLGG